MVLEEIRRRASQGTGLFHFEWTLDEKRKN